MSMKTEPFLSGKWGWNEGESGWKAGVDENFLKFSYLFNGNVDGFVSSLPVSPTDGTAYYLSSDLSLNARVDGVWYKTIVPKGFTITEKSTGDKYEFSGTAFVKTFRASDRTKFDAIATGATANSSDATLLNRANHTGAQAIATVTGLQTALDLKAPLASPTFTGTPTAPTPTTSDNNTNIATTAFVKAQGYVPSTGTVVLPSTTSIGTVTAAEIATLVGVTSGIQAQINGKAASGHTHALATTSTDGFLSAADKTKLDSLSGVGASPDAYLLARSNHTGTQAVGTITGLGSLATLSIAPVANGGTGASDAATARTNLGIGNIDNTSDVSKPVSTAQQTALNLKANLASPTLTGTVVLPSTTSIGTVSNTEISYLDGVTSAIQTQIDSKQASLGYTPINKVGDTGVGAITFSGLVTGNGGARFSVPSIGAIMELNTNGSYGLIKMQVGGVSKGHVGVDATNGISLCSVNESIALAVDPDNATIVTYRNIEMNGHTITNAVYAGNGANIGALNASNVATGTLAAARLPYTFSSTAGADTAVLRDASTVINSGSYNKTTNGYATLMNGMFIQWGTINTSSSGVMGGVSFPIAFPSGATPYAMVGTSTSNSFATITLTPSNSSQYSVGAVNNAGAYVSVSVKWIAIGTYT